MRKQKQSGESGAEVYIIHMVFDSDSSSIVYVERESFEDGAVLAEIDSHPLLRCESLLAKWLMDESHKHIIHDMSPPKAVTLPSPKVQYIEVLMNW